MYVHFIVNILLLIFDRLQEIGYMYIIYRSTHYIDVSKIDENRYKQALASLSCFGAYR